MATLTDKSELLASSFGFLVPLLIPWMQELCDESASISMRLMYELPKQSLIPFELVPKPTLAFETIRDSVIPQLFKFITNTADANKYLSDRYHYYRTHNQFTNAQHLSERNFELFLSSLVSDLITYAHYQSNESNESNSKSNIVNALLPLEQSLITQYIKMLIWEYYQSIDTHTKMEKSEHETVYSQTLCTKALLTILNHEYTHHLLIERYKQNLAHFSTFAQYLHSQNTHKSPTNSDIETLASEQSETELIYRRPQSQSLPSKTTPNSKVTLLSMVTNQKNDSNLESKTDKNEWSEWMPLLQMYELFEPRHKNRKKFQRIRESEEIPPPPKHTLPPIIITHKHSKHSNYNIVPKNKKIIKKPKPTSPAPVSPPSQSQSCTASFNYKIAIQRSSTTPTYGAANINRPSRRIRTMTLSRPAKLESLSKDEFMGKYLIETSKIIGQGSFAKIYRCKKKMNDTILAMKIVKKQKANKDDVRAMRREISALALVYHTNVIKIHDWCETAQHLFIVLDYCAGGNVFDRVMEQQTFTEIQASKVIKQVALALEHLHSLGIAHRDLKPENLMYTDTNDSVIKIIDFGLSNRIKINGVLLSQTDILKKKVIPQKVFSLETPCGTPHYAAPELIRNEKYGTPVDLWALGVITYMLLCGFPPFFDTNIKNMFEQIKVGTFHFPSPFWDTISDEAKDLIRKLLNTDAKKRYSAKQTLAHSWITGLFFHSESIPLPPEQTSDNNSDCLSDQEQTEIIVMTPEPLRAVLSDADSIVVYKNPSYESENKQNEKYGVIGTPMNESKTKSENKESEFEVQSPNSTHVLQTPPIPFHIESELFPEIELTESENERKSLKRAYKTTRSRVNTRGTNNVAYMVDGTIFQIQKQQINKLKLEIQSQQQNLEKLSNKLQIERHSFVEERQEFESEKQKWETMKQNWINQHKHLLQLKRELNDVVNKFITL